MITEKEKEFVSECLELKRMFNEIMLTHGDVHVWAAVLSNILCDIIRSSDEKEGLLNDTVDLMRNNIMGELK